VGVGLPVTVTVNEPAAPTVNVVEFAEVIAGAWGAANTVSVKFWVASGDTPLVAVNTIGKLPAVPAPGVPERVLVAALNVTPEGSAPLSDTVGLGFPVVVTVNEPAAPSVNVVLLADVIAGAWFTVSVKLWVAFGDTPLVAVNVIGYVPPVP